MKRAVLDLLRCPVTGAAYELDPIRTADDEIVEAFLVSRADRSVRPIFAGVAVCPRDLVAHLRAQGNVYRRSPLHDPRMVRFVRGRAGSGHEIVPFADVVGHYQDLAVDPPAGMSREPHPDDVHLGALLDALAPVGGPALVIGCGVGRSVFVVRTHVSPVLGLDRSLARVRRARNVAVTREHFFLPAPKDSGAREVRLDLGCLVRDDVDFAVADPDALPVADDAFGVVVLEARDGIADIDASAVSEARRALAPGGALVWRADGAAQPDGIDPVATAGPYVGGRP